MKRPAFQWYPGDWRRDTAVQACSLEARGFWREMLDLMHDGRPYGHLTAGGAPIDVEQLARIIGVPPAKARALLKELEDRDVFSRSATGVIYSRRMVRDEEIRNKRAAGGPKSLENPNVPRPKDVGNDTAKGKAKDTFGPSFDPSPAVAVAVASPAVAKGLVSGAENAPDAATLPPDAARFLERFYHGATPERRADVERQLHATLADGALRRRGVKVRAGSVERLEAKCREVMHDGVLDCDKAIVVLLAKIGDVSDNSPTELLARQQREEERRDEADTVRRLALAQAWLEANPDSSVGVERSVDSALPDVSRRIIHRAAVLKAWTEAGEPIVGAEAGVA